MNAMKAGAPPHAGRNVNIMMRQPLQVQGRDAPSGVDMP
jgi:hypothetical protein